MKVLAISIDPGTAAYLERSGTTVEIQNVSEPDELAGWVIDGFYDALIVDLETSGLGMFFPRILRMKKMPIPIIGIGSSGQADNWSEYRARFLEQGGDDLLHAPGNPRELMASIGAAYRRSQGGLSEVITFSNRDLKLKINLTTRQVSVNGTPIHLTVQESGIAMNLALHRRNVVTKETLLTALYVNDVDEPQIQIIDVFICKLRKKLSGAHPDAAKFVETVWGRGYRLTEEFAFDEQQVAAS